MSASARSNLGQFVPGDRTWTAAQVAYLTAHFATQRSREIAEHLGLKMNQVNGKANRLGLRKSPEHIAMLLEIEGERLRRDGVKTRFTAGTKPSNKGKKITVHPRSQATQFKPGNLSHTWVPVGTISKMDGYWRRKISDTRTKHDWVFCHVETWIAYHGPIPAGHCVCFRNRDYDNYAIENLHLMTRQALMLDNTIQRYPDELQQLIRMSKKLERKIREKTDEK